MKTIRRRRFARRLTIAVAGLLVVPVAAVAAPRGLPGELCESDPPDADYVDRDTIPDVHLEAVDCLTDLGIAEGLGNDLGTVYLPAANVRRDQMASFVARTLTEVGAALPAAAGLDFDDVEPTSPHATAISRLTQAGIVEGKSGDRYAPGEWVDRNEMATFLTRALAFSAGVEDDDLQGGETPFTDVTPSGVHAPSIAGAYELGITAGVTQNRYRPLRPVSRAAMATFLARTLDAATQRTTVADRDAGATAHAVFTYADDSGRCFEVTAGEAWVSACEPVGDAPLQLWSVPVGDSFTVVAGLAAPDVTRVEVEPVDGDAVDLALVPTETQWQAFASPRLLADVAAVVAYDGDTELARISPDDPEAPPFPANTEPDEGDARGEPVTVTDIEIGRHDTYDRVVLEVAGGGNAGWVAEYVDEATEAGTGDVVGLEGDAVLQVALRNMALPGDSGVERFADQRVEGFDVVREVYLDTVFEGVTQVFLGVDSRTPFRVFALDDPSRVVVDVVHPSAAG